LNVDAHEYRRGNENLDEIPGHRLYKLWGNRRLNKIENNLLLPADDIHDQILGLQPIFAETLDKFSIFIKRAAKRRGEYDDGFPETDLRIDVAVGN